MATPADLLKDLQYDHVNMDSEYEAVNDYLKQSNYEFHSILDGNTLSYETAVERNNFSVPITLYMADPNSKNADLFHNKMMPGLVQNDFGSILNRISREIEKKSNLFAELECLSRNLPPEDVLMYDIPVMSEYLKYYANVYLGSTQGCELLVLTKHTPLCSLGMAVSSALASGLVVTILATEDVAIAAHLFGKICLQAGVPARAISVVLVSTESLKLFVPLLEEKYNRASVFTTNLMFGRNEGTAVVVTETGDIDSAIDMVLFEATWSYVYPWRANRLLVQESIYDEFKKRFRTKIATLKATQQLPEGFLPKGAEIWHCPQETAASTVRVVISDNINWSRQIDRKVQVMTMQAYRSTKELLALLRSDTPFAISVWCDSVSVSNEISLAADVAVVWINMYGQFDASVPLRIRDRGLGVFGGDLGLFKHSIQVNSKQQFQLHGHSDKLREEMKLNVQQLNKLLTPWKSLSFDKRVSECLEAVLSYSAIYKAGTPEYEELHKVVRALRTPSALASDVTVRKNKLRVHISEPVGIALIATDTSSVHQALVATITSITHGNGVIYSCNVENNFFYHLLLHLNRSKIPIVVATGAGALSMEALNISEIKACSIAEPQDTEALANIRLYYTKQIWSPIGETFAN